MALFLISGNFLYVVLAPGSQDVSGVSLFKPVMFHFYSRLVGFFGCQNFVIKGVPANVISLPFLTVVIRFLFEVPEPECQIPRLLPLIETKMSNMFSICPSSCSSFSWSKMFLYKHQKAFFFWQPSFGFYFKLPRFAVKEVHFMLYSLSWQGAWCSSYCLLL